MTRIFRAGDRVEWNPTGDVWKPGSVKQAETCLVLIALDGGYQMLHVSPENLRRLDDAGDPVEWLTTADPEGHQ